MQVLVMDLRFLEFLSSFSDNRGMQAMQNGVDFSNLCSFRSGNEPISEGFKNCGDYK